MTRRDTLTTRRMDGPAAARAADAFGLALLDGLTTERVLLKVHPEAGPASAAYRAWGYRKIGESRPPGAHAAGNTDPDADLRDVMLLDLPRR